MVRNNNANSCRTTEWNKKYLSPPKMKLLRLDYFADTHSRTSTKWARNEQENPPIRFLFPADIDDTGKERPSQTTLYLLCSRKSETEWNTGCVWRIYKNT